jgi:hypothetical protein
MNKLVFASAFVALVCIASSVHADECLPLFHCKKSGTCKSLGKSCTDAPDPINLSILGFGGGGYASSYTKSYYEGKVLGVCKPGSAGGPCYTYNQPCGDVKYFRSPGCTGFIWLKQYTVSSCKGAK